VQVPTVSHTVDTVFYIFYGNASVTTDQSNPSGTWDSNFRGVWHLGDGTTLSANDSTVNGNNGAIVGSVSSVSGQVGGGARVVNAGNNDITVADSASLRIGSTLTISAWVNQTSRNPNAAILIQKRNPSDAFADFNYAFALDGNWRLFLQFHDSGGFRSFTDSGSVVPLNAWTHVAVVVNEPAGTIAFYRNGTLSSSQPKAGTMPSSVTVPLQIGNYGQYAGGVFQFSGIFDELHVSNSSRTADWLQTEYNNQSGLAPFYTAVW